MLSCVVWLTKASSRRLPKIKYSFIFFIEDSDCLPVFTIPKTFLRQIIPYSKYSNRSILVMLQQYGTTRLARWQTIVCWAIWQLKQTNLENNFKDTLVVRLNSFGIACDTFFFLRQALQIICCPRYQIPTFHRSMAALPIADWPYLPTAENMMPQKHYGDMFVDWGTMWRPGIHIAHLALLANLSTYHTSLVGCKNKRARALQILPQLIVCAKVQAQP